MTGNGASDSIPDSGDGVPSLSQPPHPCEENSNSSVGTGVPARGPEPPDLADRSSQSSLASLDDAGPSVIKSFTDIHVSAYYREESPLCS